jgi:hypothetical protein
MRARRRRPFSGHTAKLLDSHINRSVAEYLKFHNTEIVWNWDVGHIDRVVVKVEDVLPHYNRSTGKYDKKQPLLLCTAIVGMYAHAPLPK